MSLAYNFKYSRVLEKEPCYLIYLSRGYFCIQVTANTEIKLPLFVSSIHTHLLLPVFILNSSSRLTYPEVIL